MRTTINISDGILEELRELSRKRRRPFREIVEETLQRGLSEESGTDRRKVQIQTYRVGLKPAYRGMSLNQLYDQLEAEDNAGGKA